MRVRYGAPEGESRHCYHVQPLHSSLRRPGLTAPWLLVTTQPTGEGRFVIVIGDVPRQWDALARQLHSYGITQPELIQVGDFGVGFGPQAQEQTELLAFDAVLANTANMLWVIHGNHDDPAYFTGDAVMPCVQRRA